MLLTQLAAKKEGYSDVVYLDAKSDTYLEEVSSCNIFCVKGKTIKTPPLSVRLVCSNGVRYSIVRGSGVHSLIVSSRMGSGHGMGGIGRKWRGGRGLAPAMCLFCLARSRLNSPDHG